MKNKKGFTLVELLAVIVILGIIVTLIAPKLIGSLKISRENALDKVEEIIISAANTYAIDNDINSTTIIGIGTLCNTDYLNCPLINPVDNEEITGCIQIDVNEHNALDYTYISDNIVCNSNTHTLIFYANGGTVTPTSKTVTHGESYGELPTATKAGHNFVGWYTTRTGGMKVTNSAIVPVRVNETLYARYEIVNYELTVNLGRGTLANNPSGTYEYGSTIRLGIPTWSGGTFKNWAITSGDGILSGNNLTILSDVKVTAYFEIDNILANNWQTLSGITQSTIKSITFYDTSIVTGPDLAGLTGVDVSEKRDGKILLYRKPDATNSSMNNIYIVSDNVIGFPTNSSYLFSNSTFANDLKNVETINFNNSIDTSKVTNMSNMFYGCGNLTELNLSSFNTSNVISMKDVFYGCINIESINLSSFDTSNVTNMSHMFALGWERTSTGGAGSGNNKLLSLDLSSFDTSKVTNMTDMFFGCKNLITLNVSHFDTSNVTNMSGMFEYCESLVTLNVSDFDTSKVIDMSSMFEYCKNLAILNVSNFDTSNVTSMFEMFGHCESLEELDLSSWNTSNVTGMSYMFDYCINLATLDVSNFNTLKVTTMSHMFWQCKNLQELDLSSFNTSKVTSMEAMFNACTIMEHIYVGNNWNTNIVTNSDRMFGGCTSLVGQYGQTYDINYIDKTKAFIGTSGYLSCGTGLTCSRKSLLTVDLNGGTISSNKSGAYTTGSTISLGTPTRSGVTFNSWRITNGTGATLNGRNLTIGNSDITVKAIWNGGQLTMNLDGGTCTNCATSGSYDYEEVISLGTPTKTNYTFIGWNITAGGITYVNDSVTMTGNATAKAKWIPSNLTLTYDANGGTFTGGGTTNTVGYTTSTTKTVTPLVIKTMSSKNSSGNRKTSVTDTSQYANSASYYDDVTIPGATSLDVTIYYATESTSYDWVALYSPTIVPTSTNYNSSISGKLGNGGSNRTTYASTYHTIIEGDTVRIYFKSDASAVSYGYYAVVKSGGTSWDVTSTTSSGTYKEPTKAGYAFNGWLDSSNNPVDINNLNVTSNTTLHASWVENILAQDWQSKSGITQSTIKSITFYDTSTVTGPDLTGLTGKDVSQSQNGKILLYQKADTIDSSMNNLYIVSNTTIAFPVNSSYLFSNSTNNKVLVNLKNIDFNQSIDTSKVTNMSSMFKYCIYLEEIDLSGFDTVNVTNMSGMFYQIGVGYSVTINGTTYSGLSNGASQLRKIFGLNILNTSNVINMNNMFYGCESLEELDLSSFDTSNVLYMYGMFHQTGYSNTTFTLDVSNFDTSKVTNMADMFCQTGYESTVFTLSVSNFNTSNVTNMSCMFNGTGYKSTVFTLSVSNFNTSNVTDMSYMFGQTGFSNTTFTLDVSNFDTSKVTNMAYMFDYTGHNSTVFTLNVSNFNTSNVTNMQAMFDSTGYSNTTFTLDVSHFDTSKVTNMSYMFESIGYNSTVFTLDVSHFDTSKVTNMAYMFQETGYSNPTFTLDVSHFDTSKVTDMHHMFDYVGYNSTMLNTSITILNPNVTSYSLMFSGAASKSGSQITVNYTSETESLVDAMIATKSSGSNVVKGTLVSKITPIINTANIIATPSSAYPNTKVELSSTESGKVVSSFKLNGTLINGNKFSMPSSGATISDVVTN